MSFDADVKPGRKVVMQASRLIALFCPRRPAGCPLLALTIVVVKTTGLYRRAIPKPSFDLYVHGQLRMR